MHLASTHTFSSPTSTVGSPLLSTHLKTSRQVSKTNQLSRLTAAGLIPAIIAASRARGRASALASRSAPQFINTIAGLCAIRASRSLLMMGFGQRFSLCCYPHAAQRHRGTWSSRDLFSLLSYSSQDTTSTLVTSSGDTLNTSPSLANLSSAISIISAPNQPFINLNKVVHTRYNFRRKLHLASVEGVRIVIPNPEVCCSRGNLCPSASGALAFPPHRINNSDPFRARPHHSRSLLRHAS